MAGVISGNFRNPFASSSGYDALQKLQDEASINKYPITSVSQGLSSVPKLETPNILQRPAKDVGFTIGNYDNALPPTPYNAGGDYNFAAQPEQNKIFGMDPLAFSSTLSGLAQALAPIKYDRRGQKVETWQGNLAKMLSNTFQAQQHARGVNAQGGGGGTLAALLSLLLGAKGGGDAGTQPMNYGGGGFT